MQEGDEPLDGSGGDGHLARNEVFDCPGDECRLRAFEDTCDRTERRHISLDGLTTEQPIYPGCGAFDCLRQIHWCELRQRQDLGQDQVKGSVGVVKDLRNLLLRICAYRALPGRKEPDYPL